MLARVSARRGESAVRLALGASRAVIGRQWAVETLLIFVAGGVAGIAIGAILTKAVVALAPSGVPRLSSVTFNLPVALFTLGATAVTALLCAVIPVRHASAAGVSQLLGSTRTTASRRVLRGRALLVIAQVAFSLALIVTAVLVVRSFVNLRRIDLGFSPANVLSLSLEPRSVDPGRVNTWMQELVERARTLPGVQSAGAVLLRPLALGPIGWDSWVILEGQVNDAATRRAAPTVAYQVATPGYFEAMKIPLVRGRLFTAQDREGQPRVALVSASTARRLWPGRDPVGQRLLMPTFVPGDRVPVWRSVVGVVSDVRYRGLDDVRLDVYDPAAQGALQATDLVIRTSGDPARLLGAVQAEARALDPRVVIDRAMTMEAIVDKETAPWRFSVWVLSLFGAIAFALAGLGLFGLVSLDVAERDREFAIRLALGAQRRDVIRSAMSAAAVRVSLGLAVGILAAAGIARAIRAMLFGVTPLDAASFAGAIVLVLLVVATAAFVPARRAAAIEPLKLLRGESV
jgi:predicted permease